MGALLPGRGFVWAPLTTWCGLRLVVPALAEAGFAIPFAVTMLATAVATRTSNLATRWSDRAR